MTEFANLVMNMDTTGLTKADASMQAVVTGAKTTEAAVTTAGTKMTAATTKVGTAASAMAAAQAKATALIGSAYGTAGTAVHAASDVITGAAARARTATDTLLGRFRAFGGQTDTSMKMAAGSVANLTAQFNDIGVMLAAGQNPLQLALQQGTQITQVFRGGAANAVAMLKQAFIGLLSPLNLITIGVIAAGGFIVQWFTSGGEEVKTFSDNLDEAADKLKQIEDISRSLGLEGVDDLRAKYGEVNDELRETLRLQSELAQIDALKSLQATKTSLNDTLGDGLFSWRSGDINRLLNIEGYDNALTAEFNSAMNALTESGSFEEQADAFARLKALIQETNPDLAQMSVETRKFLFDVTNGELKARELAQAVRDAEQATRETAAVAGIAAGKFGDIADRAGGAILAFDSLGNMVGAYVEPLARANEAVSAITGKVTAQAEQARLVAVYGRESLQVAEFQHAQQIAILDAQLRSAGAAESVRLETIAAANMAFQLEYAYGNTANAAQRLSALVSTVAGNLYPAVNVAWALYNALGAAMGRIGGIASGLAGLASQTGILGQVGGAIGNLFDAAKGSGFATAFNAATESVSGLWDSAQKAVATGKSLEAVLSGAGGGGGGVAGGAAKAAEELTEAQKAAQSFADTLLGYVQSGVDGFVDWVFGGFEGGLKGAFDLLKKTILDMVAFAAKNKISIALGLAPGTAGAAGLDPADIGGGFGAAFSSSISSFGSIFDVAGNIAAGIGSGASALMATLGALVAPLAVVGALFAALRTTTTVLGEGLNITVDGLTLMAEQFQTIKKTSFFGLFSSTKTTISDVDAETQAILEGMYTDLVGSVEASAAALGVGAEAFNDFAHSVQVDTAGMTDEEAAQEVADAFGEIADAMAELALAGVDIPYDAGGAAAYLDQLASSLTAVNASAELLGLTTYDLSVEMGLFADSLVAVFGSVEEFTSATYYYFENFYSLGEQVAALTADLASDLEALGVAMPSTEEQFRALVDAANAAGDAELVAELIALAPEFQHILDLQEDIAAAAEDAAAALYGFADPQSYATLFEYNKAQALGQDAYLAAPTPPANKSETSGNNIVLDEAAAESQAIAEMQTMALTEVKNIMKKTLTFFEMWEAIGMPPARV